MPRIPNLYNDVPFPPTSAPARPPALVDDEPERLYRLHWEEDPTNPRRHPTGKFRFDAPADEYAVTYLNSNLYACFGEVYGNEQVIAPDQADRTISEAAIRRRLNLVPLHDGAALKRLARGLDLTISTTIHYSRTMRWSRALHQWYPDADGLLYVGRHAGLHLNRCLFLDRCADALGFTPFGTVASQRETTIRAADAYALAPRLFDRRTTSIWR
jgi:hypothetical protein